MGAAMEKVKQLVAAGSRIPSAILEALAQNGLSLAGFAKKYRLPYTQTSRGVNGNGPTDALIRALCKELGGTEAEWRELLWLAAKPEAVTA
jgi:hypothetical protein